MKVHQESNHMNRQLWFLLIGIGFFLSSCSLAPKYTQPQAPIPVQWPQGEAYGNGSAVNQTMTVSELSLKEFFTDPKLQKVIETALTNNRDLRLAVLNVERVRALYDIQKVDLLPTVNVVGSGSKQRVPADLSATGKSMTMEQYGVNMGIASWEIDFFGRIRSLKDRALEEYLATDEARCSAQIALVSEVARVYLTLAADRENLKLARSTLIAQQASYGLIHKRYEIGLATEIDLYRAQTRVDAARRDIPVSYTHLTLPTN